MRRGAELKHAGHGYHIGVVWYLLNASRYKNKLQLAEISHS